MNEYNMKRYITPWKWVELGRIERQMIDLDPNKHCIQGHHFSYNVSDLNGTISIISTGLPVWQDRAASGFSIKIKYKSGLYSYGNRSFEQCSTMIDEFLLTNYFRHIDSRHILVMA